MRSSHLNWCDSDAIQKNDLVSCTFCWSTCWFDSSCRKRALRGVSTTCQRAKVVRWSSEAVCSVQSGIQGLYVHPRFEQTCADTFCEDDLSDSTRWHCVGERPFNQSKCLVWWTASMKEHVFFQDISVAYGEFLVEKKHYEEAGIAFTKAEELERAQDAFQKSSNWRQVMCLACRLNQPKETIISLARTMASKSRLPFGRMGAKESASFTVYDQEKASVWVASEIQHPSPAFFAAHLKQVRRCTEAACLFEQYADVSFIARPQMRTLFLMIFLQSIFIDNLEEMSVCEDKEFWTRWQVVYFLMYHAVMSLTHSLSAGRGRSYCCAHWGFGLGRSIATGKKLSANRDQTCFRPSHCTKDDKSLYLKGREPSCKIRQLNETKLVFVLSDVQTQQDRCDRDESKGCSAWSVQQPQYLGQGNDDAVWTAQKKTWNCPRRERKKTNWTLRYSLGKSFFAAF